MAEEKKQEENKAVSSQFAQIIEQIEKLSVKDLADLVKELEGKWGVSAITPAAGAMASAKGVEAGAGEQKDEKAEYTIHLADAGSQKIAVIKAIREIRNDLGLKEAKDLVDEAPKDIKEKVPKEEAEEAKKKLEEAGAKVELK